MNDKKGVKSNIRRANETIYDNSLNKFPQNSKIKQFTFEASTGLKVCIFMESKDTIKNLIKRYINKINISENLLGNGIYFFSNGRQIEPNSEKTLEYCCDCTSILVLDENNDEIGA